LELEPRLSTYTKKSDSKWIKNLNIRPETLKLLEEILFKTLKDLGVPVAQETRARIDK
jgi:hypothetical protein